MRFFYSALITLLFFSCNNTKTNKTKLIDFVPKNTQLLLKCSNIENFTNSLNTNEFLQKLSNKTLLKNLAYLHPKNEVLICLSKDTNDSLQYSIITKYHNGLFITDSLSNTINNQPFYSKIVDSTFFATSSKEFINTLDINKPTDKDLEKIYNTTSNNKTFSILLTPNNTFFKSLFIDNTIPLKTFTNYIATDVTVNPNRLLINGVTKATDSSRSLINIFKNTIAQENNIHKITPSNSDGFMSFTFNNYKTIAHNLAKYNHKDSITNPSILFDNIVEVGIIYENKKQAIVLNSIDAIATKETLVNEKKKIDTYREVDIHKFNDSLVFTKTFSPLINYTKANLYCVLDNFFVFTNDIDMLQNIIANYQNKTTLNNKEYYTKIKEQLSDAASLLQITNGNTLNSILNNNTATNKHFKLNKSTTSAIQFIYDTNFAHINAVIKKHNKPVKTNSVLEISNIKLDKDVLNSPQFVTNHITKQKEIVVQDINNNLYLISNKGKVLWKKALQGPVLGDIKQVDIYKNGRLQLAFATPSRVYIIDRTGKNVAPFPAKFNDTITQPLAIFDYDKNKNYRFLITQGKHLLMYNAKAKIVKGFSFKSANENIICKPKHFRVGSKDYITLKTKNTLYILDRTGKKRLTPKSKNTYSNQPIYLYKNTFTTSNTNGDLISVDTKGNTAVTTLNLSAKHQIAIYGKTRIALSENKLLIKDNTIELDFGEYSDCKIFYINNKIYITVTDLQSHKIYLFDSQSKLQKNFPVYGNSSIALDNINRNNTLEFVTKGENNTIIIYQIN